MKGSFLFIALCLAWSVNAQKATIYFITSVKGDAKYLGRTALKVGDTLSNIEKIQFFSRGHVTLYSSLGSYKVFSKGQKMENHSAGVVELAKEILRIHSRTVSLSSRGDCDCVIPAECLSTDATINERLLLVDTISFPISRELPADSSIYFLQWKAGEKLVNNKLFSKGNMVYITKKDLFFHDRYYTPEDGSFITVAQLRYVGNEKKTNIISRIKIESVQASDLKSHYKTLQQAMADSNPVDVFQTFYTDIYTYYGKPNLCSLKHLVNYNN